MIEIPSAVELDREYVRRYRFRGFAKLAWKHHERGQRLIDTWHFGALCEHLQAVLARQIRTLLINIPPGMSKSVTACVLWPAYAWVEDPNLRMLCGSFDIGLVHRDAGYTLDLLRTAWFRERWGDILSPGPQATGWLTTKAQGWRIGISKGGKGTGHHPDIRNIDDADKPNDVTPVTLEETRKWMAEVIQMRQRSPGLGALVSTQQRVHLKDGTGILKDMYPDAVMLRLPMEFDPPTRCITYVGGVEFFRDPRTEKGELLCEQRADAAEVALKRRNLGPVGAAAQLQQNPVAEGAVIIDRSWFRYWQGPLPPMHTTILSVDCAFEGEATSDPVAIHVWGQHGPNFYLLERRTTQLDFLQTLDAIKSTLTRWPEIGEKLIEKKANGAAVINVLQTRIPCIIPVEPLGGKVARANAVSGAIKAGNVHVPDPKDIPGIDEFLTQVGNFPHDAHDDDVDAMTQALAHLLAKSSNFVDAMDQWARQNGLASPAVIAQPDKAYVEVRLHDELTDWGVADAIDRAKTIGAELRRFGLQWRAMPLPGFTISEIIRRLAEEKIVRDIDGRVIE